MTTTPDDMKTVDDDSSDPDITLEQFCELMEARVEEFAKWWKGEMAKQPSIFPSEMTAGDWLAQLDDWYEPRGEHDQV